MDQRMLSEQINYENFLLKVIKWVFLGVAVTAVTSIVVILSGVIHYLINFYFPVLFISVIVEIAFVWIINKKTSKLWRSSFLCNGKEIFYFIFNC